MSGSRIKTPMTYNVDESWKVIENCSDYIVSSLGRIYSLKTKTIVKQFYNDAESKYMVVTIANDDGKLIKDFVHRIVARAFLGDVSEREVHHINFIPDDNRLENLCIMTVQAHRNLHKLHDIEIGKKRTRTPNKKNIIRNSHSTKSLRNTMRYNMSFARRFRA